MKRYPCPCGCNLYYVFTKTYMYTEENGLPFSRKIPYYEVEEISDKFIKKLYKQYLKETTIINFKGDL